MNRISAFLMYNIAAGLYFAIYDFWSKFADDISFYFKEVLKLVGNILALSRKLRIVSSLWESFLWISALQCLLEVVVLLQLAC